MSQISEFEEDPRPAPVARMGRTLVVGAALVIGALVGGLLVSSLGDGQAEPAQSRAVSGDAGAVPFAERVSADARAPLPDMTLDGFAGGPTVQLASYRGRPLVVNFWATWCPPCVQEMPDFNRVAAELAGQVAFLGVDVQDAAPKAEPFVAELGITYDLAVDEDRTLLDEVQGFGMPTTLFVDAEGTIVYRHTGPLDAAGLRAALTEHLGVVA